MGSAGHVAHTGDRSNVYKILVGKLKGMRPLGRSGCRWDNIRMDLREIGGKVWTECTWIRTGTNGGLL